jgi:hypothetical protein
VEMAQFLKIDEVKHNQKPSCDEVAELTRKFIAEAKKFFDVSYC